MRDTAELVLQPADMLLKQSRGVIRQRSHLGPDSFGKERKDALVRPVCFSQLPCSSCAGISGRPFSSSSGSRVTDFSWEASSSRWGHAVERNENASNHLATAAVQDDDRQSSRAPC